MQTTEMDTPLPNDAEQNSENPPSLADYSSRTPRRINPIWGARLPAILVFFTGLVNIWSAITPALSGRLAWLDLVLPFDARKHGAFTAALLGFALLLLAQSLWRRKQVAWALTLASLLVSIPIHLFKGFDWEEAIVALAIISILWLTRRNFVARSDAPSLKQGVSALVFAFIATLGYGTAGFYLLDEQFSVNFDLISSLRQTLLMFTEFSPAQSQPITHHGAWFADSIYGIALCSFTYAAWMFARPVLNRQPATTTEYEKAHEIVQANGATAFAFCALLPDKRYWFSDGGSVVAYAVVGRVAVAMGDPIGPTNDQSAAILGFTKFCHSNDWRPGFYEVYDQNLAAHRAAGLQTLRIAHEAVVDLRNWSTAGKSGKDFRAIPNSFAKSGVVARMHEAPLSDELLAKLREVSDEWLVHMNGSEKAFSLGWFDEDLLRDHPVMTVEEGDTIWAFANLVPCFQLNECTIDLMRRRQDCPRNTMEFLFLSLFEWSKSRGYDTFNLGPSPFAGVGEHDEDPAIERALNGIYEHMNRFYNFKGLHAFKQKFRPIWRPLYLTWDGKGGLPLVAAAIIRADSGQDGWFDFVMSLRGGKK
ncbi:bifunctional lysylphosphatidylglycerol flippase/synthetase MprF [bacterium]|nr:MAG: bifunctional lysylphosphatidylglycerol flippase/synthetase MprF [bacterium]